MIWKCRCGGQSPLLGGAPSRRSARRAPPAGRPRRPSSASSLEVAVEREEGVWPSAVACRRITSGPVVRAARRCSPARGPRRRAARRPACPASTKRSMPEVDGAALVGRASRRAKSGDDVEQPRLVVAADADRARPARVHAPKIVARQRPVSAAARVGAEEQAADAQVEHEARRRAQIARRAPARARAVCAASQAAHAAPRRAPAAARRPREACSARSAGGPRPAAPAPPRPAPR